MSRTDTVLRTVGRSVFFLTMDAIAPGTGRILSLMSAISRSLESREVSPAELEARFREHSPAERIAIVRAAFAVRFPGVTDKEIDCVVAQLLDISNYGKAIEVVIRDGAGNIVGLASLCAPRWINDAPKGTRKADLEPPAEVEFPTVAEEGVAPPVIRRLVASLFRREVGVCRLTLPELAPVATDAPLVDAFCASLLDQVVAPAMFGITVPLSKVLDNGTDAEVKAVAAMIALTAHDPPANATTTIKANPKPIPKKWLDAALAALAEPPVHEVEAPLSDAPEILIAKARPTPMARPAADSRLPPQHSDLVKPKNCNPFGPLA